MKIIGFLGLVFSIFLMNGTAHSREEFYPSDLNEILGALGSQIPFPLDDFQQKLLALDWRSDIIQTTLPHGRSLERKYTDFSQPRSIMSWQNNPKGVSPYLLYIAYTPRLEQLEVISWNWSERHFDFNVISDYANGKKPKLTPVPRALCIACHQNEAPMLTLGPWEETTNNRDILNQLRNTPDIEPFARKLIWNSNGVFTRVFTDPPSLDLRVRKADSLFVSQKICASACGDDIECRKEQLLVGILGYTDESEQSKYYRGSSETRLENLMRAHWPADDFVTASSILPPRALSDGPLEFSSDEDPLMPRMQERNHPEVSTPDDLNRFSLCLNFTDQEINRLKSLGTKKIEAAMSTRQVADVAAQLWPQGSTIVSAFESAVASPAPETKEVVQLPTFSAAPPQPFGKNPTSGELFQHYCKDCHGGAHSRAPTLKLDDLKSLHYYVGSAGRIVQNLMSLDSPLMPPISAPQPTRGEREKMLHDLQNAN